MSNTLIFDVECYRNYFYLGVLRVEDMRRVGFEFSDRSDFDRQMVRRFMQKNLTVGFNSLRYDLPMLYLALSGAACDHMKDASNHLISNNVPYWQAERDLGIAIPKKLNHIDLFDTNPAVMMGLKTLNGRMHMKRLQELPYDHETILTHHEMDRTNEYCQFGDIDGTHSLFDRLREPIKLREAVRKQYNTVDLRSKSDAQVGEIVLKTEVERTLGERVQKKIIPEGSTFNYEVPDWIEFKTPYMQHVLKTVAETKILIGKGGRVVLPRAIKNLKIEFDGLGYTIGIGGLHSKESNRCVESDEDNVLIEGDVASQYPAIIMERGIYPKALGPHFLPVYKSLIDTRLKAKKSGDKVTDKGLKIAINGAYGKFGSGFSALYAPQLMITTTLTGQLSLLMLIERAHLNKIPVVSANTDGIIFRCPRDKWAGFILREDGSQTDRLAPSPIQDIIDWWEKKTTFNLEFNEYKAVYSLSVNTYIALLANGKTKRKGDLANHWSPTSEDYDPLRDGLKKNPKMNVCSDAVLSFLTKGTDIETYVRSQTDVREFLTIVAATGGSTWRDEYVGKLVRYIWSTDGEPIIKLKAHATTGNRPKVPSTDGSRPMMELPDDFQIPDDIDFDRYVANAYKILSDIGYVKKEKPSAVIHWLVNSCVTNQRLVA
jgi:hypothetical protein